MLVTILDPVYEPPFLVIDHQPGDQPLRLRFTSTSPERYHLEVSPDLKTWDPVLDPVAVLADTDYELEWTDEPRFFRLVAEP
jgi:hypothetical protein